MDDCNPWTQAPARGQSSLGLFAELLDKHEATGRPAPEVQARLAQMQRLAQAFESIKSRSVRELEEFKEKQIGLIQLLDTAPLTAKMQAIHDYLEKLRTEEKILSNAYVDVPVEEQLRFERWMDGVLNGRPLRWARPTPPQPAALRTREVLEYAGWLLSD